MAGKDLKTRIKVWADRIGEKQAFKELVNADIGASTAERLIKGTYKSTPKRITKTLEALLAKAS